MTSEKILKKIFISVCICTYKRPHLLSHLLKALDQQESSGAFEFEIIIVDNDNFHSAEPIVNKFKEYTKRNVKYAVEEEKNVSLARNKAINLATGDLIAFIDDDEIPPKCWLLTLFKALEKHDADAVMGPVFPIYQIKPPSWIMHGNFHKRPTYETGFFFDWKKGRTGNLLIKKSIFYSFNIFFDPRFGRGGEDQDITRRLMEKGVRFLWCNEASVREFISPDRCKIDNMIKKAFIRGIMSSKYPGLRWFIALKSLIALIIYTMALPILFIVGFHFGMSYLIKMGDHSGRIYAIIFNK